MAERREDLLFAKLLIRHAIVDSARVIECLDAQEAALRTQSHPVPRLGDLLVRKGYASSDALSTMGSSGAAPARVFGKFVLTRLLGSGGMGDVWLATDTALDRRVALKFVKLHTVEDRLRFRREAQVAATLMHPNIAAVYEVGDSGVNDGWIAMQYIDGRTLDQVPRGDPRLIVRLLRDAARAIQAAHEKGIVHRDLKPANMMLQKDHVFVLDFGLAKRTDAPTSLSLSGQVIGTPAYMPPEQARGEIGSIDARSDVYSLGATLYHLLTGGPPFRGEVFDIIAQVVSEEPKPISSLSPRVPRDLQVIVAKAMDKEAPRRYPTAAALADDLDRWLGGEAVEARPASVVYRASRFLRKHRVVAAITLVAGIAAGAAGMFAFSKMNALTVEHKRQSERQKAADVLKPASALLDEWEYRGAGMTHEQLHFVSSTIEAARRVYPTVPEVALEDGRHSLAVGAYADARVSFTRVIEEPSLKFLGHYYRARAALISYAHLRPLPVAVRTLNQFVLNMDDLGPESPVATQLREQGLADLAVLEREGPLGGDEPRLKYGRILAALYAKGSNPRQVAEDLGRLAGSGRLPVIETIQQTAIAWFSAGEFAKVDETFGRLSDPGHSHPEILAIARAMLAEEKNRRGEDPLPLANSAIELFGKALERKGQSQGHIVDLHGNRAVAFVLLAQVDLDRGRPPTDHLSAAMKDVEAALAVEPESRTAWNHKGAVLQMMAHGAGDREAEDLFRQAVDAFEHASRSGRENAPALVNAADTFSRLGEWRLKRGRNGLPELEEALSRCDAILERHKAEVMANAVRGITRLRMLEMGSPDVAVLSQKAIEDLTVVIAADGRNPIPYSNRGAVYGQRARAAMASGGDATADLKAALDDLSRAVDLAPGAPIAWNNRGLARYRLAAWKMRRREDATEETKGAIDDFGKAIAINPAYAPAWRNRGTVHDLMAGDLASRGDASAVDEWKLAIDDTAKAVQLAPTDAENPYNLGTSRLKLAQYQEGRSDKDRVAQLEEAIADFTRAIEMNSGHVSAWANRGQANYLLDRWEPALRDFEKAVELRPSVKAKVSVQMEECRRNVGK